MGKITILSGLGQPLRAELAITASPDELSGMTARLAPPEVFRQAGIDYAGVPQDLHFAVEKRPGGQAIVKVSSVKPVNEPFLDFLVELNWPAGRLVREYTFLLDPPDVVVKQAPRAVTVDTRVVDTVQGGGAQSDPGTIMPRRAAPTPAPARVAAAAPKEAASSQTRVVKPGDTLRRIASEMQYEGVSLEQMLVGLFRHNPEAFSGNNMNRLRAGAIINLPDQEAVAAIPEAEARRVFNTQAADWNTYRRKLAAAAAAAPAAEAAGSQASSGQITARVEEKAAPAEQARDQVKVARTDATTPAAAAGKAAAEAEADRIARDKALKEGQERVTMLERNVAELQKLLEFKNQQLAELQQQAARKEAVIPEAPAKAVEPPKPAEPASAVESPKAEEVPAEPAPAPDAAEAPEVAAPVAPAPAPAPVEPPKAKAPPPAPEPEPEPEPDLLDSIFGDPLLVGGAGALALLAGGYFIYRRRRADGSTMETEATPALSSLGPNSVFRMTGGQSVDTGNTPPQTGDFSQTGPGTIDTDEVDPVAEADVYMAYGRDTQAEEILLEALQKDPQRLAIHVKLLEIYANRRSVKQFETLASELYAQTGGAGPEWEKVATLGAGLDPQNPLYSGAAPKASAFDANATKIAAPAGTGSADVGRTTVTMAAGMLAQMAAAGGSAEPNRPAPVVEEEEHDTLVLGQPLLAEPPATVEQPVDPGSLDFDLGVPQAGERPVVSAAAETPAVTSDDDVVLDFDISGDVPLEAAATVVGDLRLPDRDADKLAPAFGGSAAARSKSNDGGGHDFSAAGTLVMPPPPKNDIDFLAEAAVSTFVGEEKEKAKEPTASTQPAAARLAADLDAAAATTVVNPVSADNFGMAAQIDTLSGELGDATLIASHSFAAGLGHDDQKMVETMLSPATDADGVEFDVSLTDSVFLGEPMVPPEFDIGSINLDLAAQPAPAEAAALTSTDVTPAAPDAQWEEVNTKLDLAKAYEEMGDLEGARELLQEVLAEGSPDLVEQAKAVLVRIGE
ncbi:FimV/HubP family polar landmark protein [Azonexus sp.]|uniref:FimV/HubP family polar landmark protein n=1 Tax=Azonexus sp. TaxID=1872668 RepID=UPI00281D5255|nr:FimV/HubP family polar landmark protein [Azonexus sp.]MDR1996468.1 pilus assembly protein [Azonexus sp.]